MGFAAALARDVPDDVNDFLTQYTQGLRLIERLHRLLLDVIKDELDRLGVTENTVEAQGAIGLRKCIDYFRRHGYGRGLPS